MPYKKQTVPFIKLSRLLKGYDLNPPALAKVLGVSMPTARTKLNNPSKLTLDDLSKIHRFGHINWDEIKATIGD